MLGPLLEGRRTRRELLRGDGLLGELAGRSVERALAEGLAEHLAYPAAKRRPVPRVTEYVSRELADEPKFIFSPVGRWSTDTELTFLAPRARALGIALGSRFP